jgi:ornithine cyclodeaminase
MSTITILTESQLRQVVALDREAIDHVERAFVALAGGQVVMPPILSMAIKDHNGEVDVKTAYMPGVEGFAIKISPGFFDNPSMGLPSTSGLMILLSARTGQVDALLLDNGYLTDLRTAAAGAVAARHLAPEGARSACVLGTGLQARLQMKALSLVRPLERATVWGRDPAKAENLARALTDALGIPVSPAADPAAAVTAADVVLTTTPATEPILKADWLRPGQHVTAMGSDQHGKNEVEPACLAKADLYVPDRQSQTEVMGELRAALAAGTVSADRTFPELGEIVAGTAPGRRTPEDLTLCDLTGTATFARARARAAGFGLDVES